MRFHKIIPFYPFGILASVQYFLFSSSAVTLQVFLNQDIQQLNKMLKDDGLSKADLHHQKGNTVIPPRTYWLIYLCNNNNSTDIKNAFKLSPLRYDTRSFVFLVKGDLIAWLMKSTINIFF